MSRLDSIRIDFLLAEIRNGLPEAQKGADLSVSKVIDVTTNTSGNSYHRKVFINGECMGLLKFSDSSFGTRELEDSFLASEASRILEQYLG